MKLSNCIESFDGYIWKREINVRDFIQHNYTPYYGDESFLVGPTAKTTAVWNKLSEMFKVEREKGVYDAEQKYPQSLTTYGAGYIDKENEVIVGLQTDAPLKRGIFPKGGIRMVEQALDSYGYKLDPETKTIYTKYRKTHNEGVFSAYTRDIRAARHSHIITGLPDAYGRGRIIGDYRRIALYGVDNLIDERKRYLDRLDIQEMTEECIQKREETSEQIAALKDFVKMCANYGFDVTRPAQNAREAVQFVYFGYLGAVKDQDGAAMSLGRVSTFLDIFIERDIKEGRLTEAEAQELVDQLIIKLRIVRFLRTPEYNDLFSGDPVWVTESLGGAGVDGRPLVTKTSYRFLHTLENLGPAPEPNLTVLWFNAAPENWKNYCAKMSIKTSAIQYENDDLMRPDYGDDYGIACCVSPMKIGKQMQFFGARANLAKALLYAINGGRDEEAGLTPGVQVGPELQPITSEYLDYNEVMHKYDIMLDWLAGLYVNALNAIHYMHDKYYYEAAELALIDTDVRRTFATGIAGFSHVVDSISAIKYAKVKVLRRDIDITDKKGKRIYAPNMAYDFKVEGDFPRYGQDDDRADEIAKWLLKTFIGKIKKHHTYRNAEPTTSILTITSNVVYGKATGALPNGRKAHEPFSPGANPSYGAETNGLVASLNSVAKVPYEYALDGISNTQTINPSALGHDEAERVKNLVNVMDGYFAKGAHHLNVNVFGVEKLKDCQAHPEKPEYANFTVRVSGYAVRFINLTKEQQDDVIARTCHAQL